MPIYSIYYSDFKKLGSYKTLEEAREAAKTLAINKSRFILETADDGSFKEHDGWGMTVNYYKGVCNILNEIRLNNEKKNISNYPSEIAKYYIDNSNITIIGILGEGSQAMVYKASYKDNVVAIRYLQKSSVKNMIGVEKRELEISMESRHRNVIRVIGVTEGEDGKIGIITNLYTEGDLKRFLEVNKELEINQILKLILDVAKGVRYLHENGAIHRDIKPENILVTRENEIIYAVLSDLGTVRIIEDSCKGMTMVGTDGFIAPEVYRRSYDSSADIYSLGATLREVLKERYTITDKLIKLITICTDETPSKRPDIELFIRSMLEIINIEKETSTVF